MTSTLTGRPALVVGLARSGVAAARLLVRRGHPVTATDARPLEALGEEVRALADLGVDLRCGTNAADHYGARLVVASPGVPLSAPPLAAARAAGAEIIAEIELGWRALGGRRYAPTTIAVTGTNGKSTVCELCGAMAAAAGLEVEVAGNVGRPLCALADDGRARIDVLVLELSSYQLELTRALHPSVAMILNLTPDHLERHGDLEGYLKAKTRIFEAMGPGDHALLPAGDERLSELPLPAGVARHLIDGGAWRPTAPGLRGAHNRINAHFAAAAAGLAGISTDAIEAVLATFPGLRHRIEHLGDFGGITAWDDSKATNVDATVRALATVEGPKVLIAGGVPKKGDDFALLARESRAHGVKSVALTGQSAPAFAEAFRAAGVPVLEADARDFAAVVRAAAAACEPGDNLLLAPACASFDQFRDYEDRGERFAALAREALSSRAAGGGRA